MKIFLCRIDSTNISHQKFFTKEQSDSFATGFYYTKTRSVVRDLNEFYIFCNNLTIENIKSIFSKHHFNIIKEYIFTNNNFSLKLDEESMFRLTLMGLRDHDILLQ